MLTIRQLRAWATRHEPIYFQLYLDKCFWCKQDIEEFEFLVAEVGNELCDDTFVMLSAWVEGTDWYKFSYKTIALEEHYWTLAWGKMYGKSWIDKLPLPKRHSRLHNAEYKKNCKSKYLMLDFYELG